MISPGGCERGIMDRPALLIVRAPPRLVAALDVLLALWALWMVVPELVWGGDLQINFPFDAHFSSTLSHRNLFIFLGLFLIRLHLGKSAPPAHPIPTGLLIILTAVGCFAVYVNISRPAHWPSGDTLPARYLPGSILYEHNLDLDEFVDSIPPGRRYALFKAHAHRYPGYPPAVGLSVLPLYALYARADSLSFSAWYTPPPGPRPVALTAQWVRYEQWTAALVTVCALALLGLFVRRVTSSPSATVWIMIFAGLATPLTSSSSQALWQHTPVVLCITAAAWLLSFPARNRSLWTASAAGLFMGWAAACRPTLALVLPLYAIGLWIVNVKHRTASVSATPATSDGRGGSPASLNLSSNSISAPPATLRRRSDDPSAMACGETPSTLFPYEMLMFLLGAAIMLIPIVWLHLRIYGHPLGAYAIQQSGLGGFHPGHLLAGFFHPSRGLFVFSPFLLPVALIGIFQFRKLPVMARVYLICAGLMACPLAAWRVWWGGACFGPRLMTECALYLLLLMPFCWRALLRRPILRGLLLLGLIIGAALHILGPRHGDQGWTDRFIRPATENISWSLINSQAAWTLQRDKHDQ